MVIKMRKINCMIIMLLAPITKKWDFMYLWSGSGPRAGQIWLCTNVHVVRCIYFRNYFSLLPQQGQINWMHGSDVHKAVYLNCEKIWPLVTGSGFRLFRRANVYINFFCNFTVKAVKLNVLLSLFKLWQSLPMGQRMN